MGIDKLERADFPSKSERQHGNIKQASSANIRISI